MATPMEIKVQLKNVSEGKLDCYNCEDGDATKHCKQCAIVFCEKCFRVHSGLKVYAKHEVVEVKEIDKMNVFSLYDSQNVSFSSPASVMAFRIVTATLSFQAKLGSPYKLPPSLPLTCHLISPDSSQTMVTDIEETEVGKYSISFIPSSRGEHQLKIQVGGIDIDGLVSLIVVPSPKMRHGLDNIKIINNIKKPVGIAVDKDGCLIVAEKKNGCVSMIDKNRSKKKLFGSKGTEKGEFSKIHGVAVTQDGHILVTDKHRLQKLTPEGHCVMSVGSSESGDEPLEFDTPQGIAVHPITGQIYVADHGNNRIQVLNEDFTYSHSFGSGGSYRDPGRLSDPTDVAFDDAGNVYVTHSCYVEIFTPEGKHLKKIGTYGSGKGEFTDPSSIVVDIHNMMYVLEGCMNNRVSVFTTDGEFVQHLRAGTEEFMQPQGIAIDTLGNIYISDRYKNRIVIL